LHLPNKSLGQKLHTYIYSREILTLFSYSYSIEKDGLYVTSHVVDLCFLLVVFLSTDIWKYITR